MISYRGSDVLVLNVPITTETRGMITAERLHQMKPTAILINITRVELVDETALFTALKEGWIAGAGLDVFNQEPISPANPLLQLDNVVLTPHVASGTMNHYKKRRVPGMKIFAWYWKGRYPTTWFSFEQPDWKAKK